MYNTTRTKTFVITTSALLIALTAICSWISIPIPGTSVPINLATFAVILTGTLLGSRRGAMAMIVFLLLGTLGVPVFHNFTGGVGIVFGPTGGFLLGYIALAYLSGRSVDNGDCTQLSFLIAVVLGEVVLYALGTGWFLIQTGGNLQTALLSCVLPFLPGDIVKIILVSLIRGRLRTALGI